MRAESTSLLIEPPLSETGEVQRVPPKLVSVEELAHWSARLEQLVGHVAIRWGLTARQRQVLDLVARGKANKEVASVLGISERTVEIHIHSITLRAGLQGRCELLAALLRDALESRFPTSLRPPR